MFSAFIRQEQKASELAVLRWRKKIALAPTYPTGRVLAPAEDKVRTIPDSSGGRLAVAGRVASELTDIIRKHPRKMRKTVCPLS